MEHLNLVAGDLWNWVLFYGPKIVYAILTLIVGLWVVKRIVGLVKKLFDKKDYDESLEQFLLSLIRIILKVLLVLTVIQMVGIETTSFVAVLAAAGFAIGMALQGSLGNFAGGVLILIFKPFKVGDVIDAQGFVGKVDTISIFNTILKTPDNRVVYVPNGALSSGPITNVTQEDTRRVDFTFGIGYDDDIAKSKGVLQRIIESNDKIMKDPEPFIVVGELADSSVNFTVRVWSATDDYWDVYFYMQEQVKLEFDKENISIPYPQTDVHVHNN